MALIKFSALVTGMSGKLNGSVFFRNRGGDCVRNKTTPSNPQAAAQQAVRTSFTLFSKAWRALTETDRASWNESAALFPVTDPWGDSKILSGMAFFMQRNINASTVGGTQIDEAPSFTAPTDAVGTAFSVTAAGVVTYTMDFTTLAGRQIVCYATAPLSAGIYNFKKYLRVVDAESAPVTGIPTDIAANYIAKFGDLTGATGKKVGFSFSAIDPVTGDSQFLGKGSAIVA